MDKIAANNQFTKLRKEIKKAKAMLGGHFVRKIKELNKEKEKAQNESQIEKINARIKHKYDELKMIKDLDWYIVAKDATLKPDFDYWNKLISDLKKPVEERLEARVICKNNLKKQIQTFRSERPELDEWINEYIEYREKKKDIVEHMKRPQSNNRQKKLIKWQNCRQVETNRLRRNVR